ncbi:methyltransferase [Aureococcus anophagefferens]|nr:methyltransferase [Aureococcus anophagefferens]
MEHHDAAFWDAEYASGALGERAFDWLFDFAELGEARWRALLGPLASATVIEAMRAAHPALAWEVRDARDLPPRSFDVVLDKACLDAVLCYADASAADACVAEHGGADHDGYGGGAPRALSLVETRFRDVAVEELAASRSIAPTYDDVRPTHYAQIVARAPADPTEAPPPPPAAPPPREPHIDDYDAYYSGALTDGPPDPHDAFCSWAALAPKFAAAGTGAPRLRGFLDAGGWRVDAQEEILSDVGAGERTFDWIVAAPPPD